MAKEWKSSEYQSLSNVFFIFSEKLSPLSFSSSRIKMNHSEMLQIHITNEQDGGTYTCLASNSVGKSEKHFFVDVFLPPTFEYVSTNRHKVHFNRTYTLPCLVKGIPRPTIKWLKNGKAMLLDVNHRGIFRMRGMNCLDLETTNGILSR